MKMKKQIELENTRYRYLSEIMKEVIFEYDYRSDMLRLTSEAVEIFKVPEVIEHFSSYQSEILVVDGKGNNPLYEQLMKKVDTDADVNLIFHGSSLWYHIYMMGHRLFPQSDVCRTSMLKRWKRNSCVK